ncbi:MAG: restriction endonuclease [Bacilli bacterium]|nr:restriction endonuclease [Bacilli bacterium]
MLTSRCLFILSIYKVYRIESITYAFYGTYVCTKRILKKSSYKLDGNEPDLLVFVVQQKRVCKIIELKDGDSFDTKKAWGEQEHLERFNLHIGAKIPFVSDYYVCCFNQTNKEEIVKGFKNAFEIEHVMTGKELCEILGISYDEIIEERKKDAKANMEYFYQQLMSIPAIKEMMEDEKNNNGDNQ